MSYVDQLLDLLFDSNEPQQETIVTVREGASANFLSKYRVGAEFVYGACLKLVGPRDLLEAIRQDAEICEQPRTNSTDASMLPIEEYDRTTMIQMLQALLPEHLNSCADSECIVCAMTVCPYQEPLHNHHDGCPACTDFTALNL